MYDLMLYSLKTGACLAVFYLFFKLLLSRETFHRFNRILLLGAIIISFLLPLCVITVHREITPFEPVMVEELTAPVEQIVLQHEQPPFPWKELAGGVFLLGVAVSLGATIRSLWGVVRRIRNNPHEELGEGLILVRSAQKTTPFSWWRYVVISECDLAESGPEILLHEGAHIRMRHSVDLLVTDIAGCLQWFNPAMWLLRRELRDIHEYEADEAVLESGADARQYQMLLIKKAAGGRWYSVANSFNHSKLKNRITMMLRKKSSRWAGAKALLALPLAGLALGAFAETVYVFPDDKDTQKKITTHIDPVDEAELAGDPVTIQGDVDTDASTENTLAMQQKGEKVRTMGSDTMSRMVVNMRVSFDAAGQKIATKDTSEMYTGSFTYSKTDDDAGQYTLQMTYVDDPVQGIEQAVAKQDPSAQRQLESAMRSIEDILSKKDGTKVTPEVRKQLSNTLTQLEDLYLQLLKMKKEGDNKPVVVVSGRISDKEVASVLADGVQAGSFKYITMLNPKPLVIIDGQERSTEEIGNMNSKNVESISILKDASAVETYGDKAKNGVVVVKTKKGAPEKISGSIVISSKSGQGITLDEYPEGMLVFIDGKKASRSDFEAIDRQKVKRMEQIKGNDAIKEYGEDARNGVLKIYTRK